MNLAKTILYFKSLDSTNDYLKSLVQAGAVDHGTVVDCEEQTAGKGMHDNKWDSKVGQNIHLSVYIKPQELEAREQFLISQAVACALFDFLSHHLRVHKIQIKWPNDLLVDRAKISGILIENFIQGKYVDGSVIGIGININQEQFPYTYQRMATSLSVESKKQFELKLLKQELYQCLEKRMNQIRSNQTQLQFDYITNLYAFDQEENIDWGEGKQAAKVHRLDEWGRIYLKSKGEIKGAFSIKELVFY